MAQTFLTIRSIVLANNLNNGFMQNDIIALLQPNQANPNTIRTFIWKHAINGGNVNTLYFQKLNNGQYQINPEYLA